MSNREITGGLHVLRGGPYAERKFDPAMRRDTAHAHEQGVGGACWWVFWHAKGHIGFVVSDWDHEVGVHFQGWTHNFNPISSDGVRVNRHVGKLARVDAVNDVLASVGLEPNWPLGKTTHGVPKPRHLIRTNPELTHAW